MGVKGKRMRRAMGRPVQAVAELRKTVAIASRITSQASQAYVMLGAGQLHLMQEELRRAKANAFILLGFLTMLDPS